MACGRRAFRRPQTGQRPTTLVERWQVARSHALFADLDETIRQLLIRDVPLDLSEVDISFETPDRDWSGRLSRPTINCFLYDVRENLELRATDFEHMRNNSNGTTTTRRLPARVDATYQITIWARAPEEDRKSVV